MLTRPIAPPPRSCDTFVFVVAGAGVVFGKNADRPSDEAHEVLYLPAQRHPVRQPVSTSGMLLGLDLALVSNALAN
jgi:hypothetical protein